MLDTGHWTLLTTPREPKGHEDPTDRGRPMAANHGHGHADKRNGLERRRDAKAPFEGLEPPVYALAPSHHTG